MEEIFLLQRFVGKSSSGLQPQHRSAQNYVPPTLGWSLRISDVLHGKFATFMGFVFKYVE